MSRMTATLIEHGKVGRIEEQQVKCLPADAAMEETSESNAVQAGLRLLRPGLVQLHAVGVAAVSLGDLAQGLPAPAARIQQVGDYPLRKPDSPQDEGDVLRICGVIAQLDVVHEAAHHAGAGDLIDRKDAGKGAEGFIDGLIASAHQIKAGQSSQQFFRRGRCPVLLRLHEQRL